MKQISFLLIAVAISTATFSQSERYTKAMESNIAKLDSTITPQACADLANSFQRIADAEKNQWLPYYYAAYSNIMNGYMMMANQNTGMADKLDPLAAKAEELISKAEGLTKENAEIYLVKKMISGLKMMGDPQTRWQTEVPIAEAALNKAKSLEPNNPRIFILEGQDKFYT